MHARHKDYVVFFEMLKKSFEHHNRTILFFCLANAVLCTPDTIIEVGEEKNIFLFIFEFRRHFIDTITGLI